MGKHNFERTDQVSGHLDGIDQLGKQLQASDQQAGSDYIRQMVHDNITKIMILVAQLAQLVSMDGEQARLDDRPRAGSPLVDYRGDTRPADRIDGFCG
jgi:hypothetical protein